MLRKIKTCLTAFIATAVMISCAGCTVGTSTATTMSADGFDLKSGVYIFYQNMTLEEAKTLAEEENENLDIEDQDALEEATIDGKKFLDWVYDETLKSCKNHIAIIKKFDEMELTLTEESIASAKDYAEYLTAEETNEYFANGISRESIEEVLINSYKMDAVFTAIYGEGGTENVQESTLKDNFIANNARVKYVALDLHDADGNDLDEAGKAEIKKLADEYLKTVKSAKDNAEMLEKFNEISEEYTAYTEEKAAEAAGETEETTEAVTTAAEESTDTTTTTTTVDPYANEEIIAVVTTDEDTTEEDLTYTPSKAFYDWAYNTATKTGVPEIIEDEGKIYVAVKLDIEERMTSDDLWTETAIYSERSSLYSEPMQDKIEEWANALNLTINEDAVDRYDPFDYEIPETETTNNNMVAY